MKEARWKFVVLNLCLVFHRLQLAEAFGTNSLISDRQLQRISFAPTCTSTQLSLFDAPAVSDTSFWIVHQDEIETVTTSLGEGILSNPAIWSAGIMLTIVGLLASWEASVEVAREYVPAPIQRVIDRILGEMGGLGFIGLVLSTGLSKPAFGDYVGQLSERYLGDEEILVESFEFLHETFFQAAIVFFITASVMVLQVIQSTRQLADYTEECIDATKIAAVNGELVDNLIAHHDSRDGDDGSDGVDEEESTAKRRRPMKDYEACLKVQREGERENPWFEELTMGDDVRGAQTLVIRERLIREMDLPQDFRMATYIEECFAKNQLDFFEISPFVWLPLIPVLALANSVDIAHDVVNSASPNALESSGYFLGTPSVFIPFALWQVATLAWGLFNSWKMANIKCMLLPRIVEDARGRRYLEPPPVESSKFRASFQSTPFWVAPIERLYREEPTNRVEELFGDVGGAGPEFYLDSIKLHTWLVVAAIVGFAFQVLPRDLYAVQHPELEVGIPDLLRPEIYVFETFAVINVLQLWLSTRTFRNYCIVTGVEDMVALETLEKVSPGSFAKAFAAREQMNAAE